MSSKDAEGAEYDEKLLKDAAEAALSALNA